MRVAVLGAGTMGHGIAQVSAMAGHDVVLRDVDEDVVDDGVDAIDENLRGGVERDKVTPEEREATLDRIEGTTDLEDATGAADLVVEAVAEDVELKQTVLGEAGLWLAADHASSGSTGSLALELTMWMLPYMPMVCVVALIGGILQVHRRFGPPAIVPVVLNLCIIAAVLLTGSGWFVKAGDDPRLIAQAAAGAVLVAGLLQLAWQWLALRATIPLRLGFTGVAAPLRRMSYAMVPLIIGLAVFQINAFLDSLIALLLSADTPGAHFGVAGFSIPYPMESGAVASLQWAQRLYQFPLGVFGIAIATAIFPALSEAAAQRQAPAAQASGGARDPAFDIEGDTSGDRLTQMLRQGLRRTIFIGLPASVGLFLVRFPLVRTIYERGAFTLADSNRVAMILAGYAAAVWAYSLSHVLTRCFYAMGDERAPVRIGLAMVGMNLTLNLLLIWAPLGMNGGILGAAGLAWSTAICATGQAIWLLNKVKRHTDHPVSNTVWQSWRRTVLLTTAMGIALGAELVWVEPAGLSWWLNTLLLLQMVALGAGIVFLGGWLAKAEEVTWLIRRRT